MVKSIAGFKDAWKERPNRDGDGDGEEAEKGMTNERPDNCFTSRFALMSCPEGKRLDYILYESGNGW